MFTSLFAGLISSFTAQAQPNLGVVAIDVQKVFVSEAVNPNINAVIGNIQTVFQLADQYNLPFLITFEASTKGDHALASGLSLPHQQQTFIKTKFAATGLPAFAAAAKNSGVTHFIVLGSETDVCVLQTVLGLRAMGFQVALQTDGVFSSEPNVSPALQRLTNAGVAMLTTNQIKNWIAGGAAPGDSSFTDYTTLIPFQNGAYGAALVLNQLDDKHLNDPSDTQAQEKIARLRELVLMAEWTQIPVYLAGVDPSRFQWPTALSQALGSKAMKAITRKNWHPYTDLRNAYYPQILVAGSYDQLDPILRTTARVFEMKDALLGRDMPNPANVPFTYKMMFYEMTKSVNPAEWPSQDWARDDSKFAPLMKPPESLPALLTP